MTNALHIAERHALRLIKAQSFLGSRRLRALMQLKRWSWLVVLHGTQAVKRFFDIAVSLVAILLAAPMMLIIALLVRRDGGPVFFKQKRVGLLGREFEMLKFRSMCVDAEAKLQALLAQNEKSQGVTFKMKHDPRITAIGRFIRKASIDELPQFFNVLRGDMSIVGPRPSLPREVALYSVNDRRRLQVKPGITCLWQVGERSGGFWEIGDRNNIDFDEQVSLDVRYIESHSLRRDLWILIKTVPAILLGKGM
ncbi:MAG: sugar transferase [Prosthecobacter sp.]|uniref:sugar transferase n=1 Tax=Prosthecobacter sp. TaxID=1965333 RepID=UPI00390411BC